MYIWCEFGLNVSHDFKTKLHLWQPSFTENAKTNNTDKNVSFIAGILLCAAFHTSCVRSDGIEENMQN